MRVLEYIIALLVGLFLGIKLTSFFLVCEARAEIVACKREMFTHCLNSASPSVSLKTNFTYTDSTGIVRTDKITRLVGCLNPNLPACSLSALRTDADRIPTAQLAAEHYWMVFNLQQMAQAELWSCWKSYEEYQKLLHQSCLITNPVCSFAAATIRNLAKYWIEFNAPDASTWWKTQAPTKEDYLFHFKVGIDGLDRILGFREQCETIDLPRIRNKVKTKYRIR